MASNERLQALQQRGQQFGYGRVDVHATRKQRVGLLSHHHFEQGMDHFITVYAENRGTQYLLRLRVHRDFHELCGLAHLARPPDTGHRHFRHQGGTARGAYLRLGHAHAAPWRSDRKGIGADALADLACCAVEQVGGNDLVIVPAGVREGPATIAVAHGIDARHAVGVVAAPSEPFRVTATPNVRLSRPRPPAFRRNSIPSPLRISRIASKTSWSLRPMMRAQVSITVTHAPKRR